MWAKLFAWEATGKAVQAALHEAALHEAAR
jgi:hypothetical protein